MMDRAGTEICEVCVFVLREVKWASRPSERHEALCQVIEVIKVEEEWKGDGRG